MKPSRYLPNENRNLWNNNGWWWMAITPWHPLKTERVRLNLKTKDVTEARIRRDEIIAQKGWTVTA